LNKGTALEGVLFELLKDDSERDQRQLAIIGMTGKVAAHNPTAAGMGSRYWGAMTGRGLALPKSRQSHSPRKKVAKSTLKSCRADPKERVFCLSFGISRIFLTPKGFELGCGRRVVCLPTERQLFQRVTQSKTPFLDNNCS